MAKTQLSNPIKSDSTNYIKHTSKNPIRKLLIKNFHNSILRIIKPLKKGSILDVGCGEGFMLDFFAKNNLAKHLEGIDLSKEAIELGKFNFPSLKLKQENIYSLPYSNNSFDLVTSAEVLEHLEDPQKALSEITRVSNRYILLSVPNEPLYRLSRLFSGINIKKLGDHPEHINHWGVKSFKDFVSKNNLKIIQTKLPFPWILILIEKENCMI